MVAFGRTLRAAALFVVAVLGTGNVLAESLVFGVVPQQSASKLAELWTPIFNYLSSVTGDEISFATATDIPTFERRVRDGLYDVAYMNPYHYTVFHQAPGYIAIAKQRDKKIKGLLVVRKDSDIETLEQLQNVEIAFPSPAAFAASVLPRAKLVKEGIKFTPRYVSSHDSVYLNVARGFMPAGGGIQRTLSNIAPAVREQLRVLWETPAYTPHAFAVHPRVSEAAVQRLQAALVGMADDPEGVKLLSVLKFKGVDAASDADWNDVRDLDIDLLDKLIDSES